MTVIDPFEAPDNVDPEVVKAVEEAAPEYTDLNLQRRFRIIFAIGIVGLLLMGWLLLRAATSGSELDSLRKRNETLTSTNESQQLLIDKLATQNDAAIAQGAVIKSPEQVAAEVPGSAEVSPIAGAQGERGEAGLPGATGEPGIGLPGSQGEKGDAGATGGQGDPGTTGAQGTPGIGVAGSNGNDGPPGPQGEPGVNGTNGTNGTDGAPGANGAPGADGAPGINGTNGTPGPPPSYWTFSVGPVNYLCTPTADPTDDPAAFACVVVP